MPPVTLESLRGLAATNQWVAIYPEIGVGVLALLVLILDLALPRVRHLASGVTLVGLGALFLAVCLDGATGGVATSRLGFDTFGGLLLHTETGHFFRLFFLLAAMLVTYLAIVAVPRAGAPVAEFHHVVLVATGALMLLAQSNHFVSLFVSLEAVTVCFYVLVSFYRRSPLSLEAGLKYLVLGALSSAVLLFGIALLYGIAGTPGLPARTADAMAFGPLQEFLRMNGENAVARIGVVLVLAGIGFKVGAFPFQMWVPDVYQGAPTPVTALLAVSSKAAGFAVLLVLLAGPFAPLASFLLPVLSVVAGATILFGNLAALGQRDVKRLIGLSGVSHAGYLLMGLAASLSPSAVAWAAGAVQFYLAAYLLASMAVFAVMVHVSTGDDARQSLDDYTDLARRQPFLGGILAIGLGSLAGIPPLAGFIGKLLLFIAVYQAGLLWLLAVAVVGVVVSIGYYFGWMKEAFVAVFRLPGEVEAGPPAPPVTPVSLPARVALGLLSAGTVVFGFVQGPLGGFLVR